MAYLWLFRQIYCEDPLTERMSFDHTQGDVSKQISYIFRGKSCVLLYVAGPSDYLSTMSHGKLLETSRVF